MPACRNFPFCTIDPNNARVNVPDDRFNWLCSVYKPKSSVPAFLDVVDIAGLVRLVGSGAGPARCRMQGSRDGGWWGGVLEGGRRGGVGVVVTEGGR